MSDLYDVKISVRSTVKLLSEIKRLLSMKANRERLFRDTVFETWLDIQSHENDSHLMHCVLQHHAFVSNLRPDCPPIIFHIGDHWLEFENRTSNGFEIINGFNLLRVLRDKKTWLNMLDEDTVRLCMLVASELVFMGKEEMNFLTKHIMWLVDYFDALNDFPWGEYMWEKFYQRTVNVIWILESYPNNQKWWSKKANVILHGLSWSKVTTFEKSDYDRLFRPLSNPNVALISSPEEMRQAWFMAIVDFIKGLGDQDGDFLQDDEARVNSIEHHNGIRRGDGVLDFEGDGVHLSQTNDVLQQAVNLLTTSSTNPQARNAAVAEFFAEFFALKKDVLLIKKRKDDEFDQLTKRFSKLETSEIFLMFKSLLKTDMCTENKSTNCKPKKSEAILNFCSNHNDTSNYIGNMSSEAKPASTSSHPENDKDASHLDDLMEIDGENAKDGYSNSQHHLHILIKALDSKTENPIIDLVVPPKDDDRILHTIKPNDACDEVEVWILEQLPNADKGKTTVLEEIVGVKFEDKRRSGRGLGPLKVKKKNCQRSLRPNYVVRYAQDRKKLVMALNPPFGQQAATTPLPQKRKSKNMKTKVSVPAFDLEGKRDIVLGPSFWLSLSGLNTGKSDWLNDHHLDLWIDLMWSLRPPEADWAIVSPHLSTCILFGNMPDYFSNGHMYPLPWLAVEKVYFPVNEPKKHWCLDELEIRTGVVTFYDSLGWAGGSRRRWWRQMKKLLLEKLTVYLLMHVTIDDPLEIALAYRERMLEYYWNHKIPVERTSLVIQELNLDVSYKRAWKGRQLALESNQGCPIASFAQLPYYCYNLKLVNENTVTHIDTDDKGRFKMLFIGFGVASGTNIQNKLTCTYSNTRCQA
nr:hypothetical protein [Tanacetum cinerariifolium]